MVGATPGGKDAGSNPAGSCVFSMCYVLVLILLLLFYSTSVI